MKTWCKALITCVLLGSLTLQVDLAALAEPFKNWFWTDPVQYENMQNIPGGDLELRTLYCGNNPADTSIPDGSAPFGGTGSCADRYDTGVVFAMQAPPSNEDMAFIVGGIPGTYYCASTVSSITYGSESGCSNEANFTVLPGALGFVPLPPTLTLQ